MQRRFFAVLVSAAMSVGCAGSLGSAAQMAPAGVQNVTLISGSQSCTAGKTVRILVWVNYSQPVYGYWPSSRTTANQSAFTSTSTTFNTGLQSTSWKVTSSDLSQANDYCQ